MSRWNLWEEARQKGWAMGQWTTSEISHFASQAGWEPVVTRVGGETVSTLRPTSQAEARPQTISAVHGLKAQPLHIDGSHILRPPDVVVLHSAEPSQTSTRVWKPDRSEFDTDAASNGLFIVGTGRSAFLAPILETSGFRFDPVIMRPADERAHAAAAYIERESDRQAHEVEWLEPNSVLVIANRRVLHGRAAVAAAGRERTLVRMAFYLGETNESVV